MFDCCSIRSHNTHILCLHAANQRRTIVFRPRIDQIPLELTLNRLEHGIPLQTIAAAPIPPASPFSILFFHFPFLSHPLVPLFVLGSPPFTALRVTVQLIAVALTASSALTVQCGSMYNGAHRFCTGVPEPLPQLPPALVASFSYLCFQLNTPTYHITRDPEPRYPT